MQKFALEPGESEGRVERMGPIGPIRSTLAYNYIHLRKRRIQSTQPARPVNQRDLICPRCRQINRRSDADFRSAPNLDPGSRYSSNRQLCSLCYTHLRTGQRSAWAIPLAWLSWMVIYAAHALAVSFFCGLPVALLWLTVVRSDWMYGPTLGATLLGLGLGLGLAETSRRRGELFSKRRS
jgi:hypothetical protein